MPPLKSSSILAVSFLSVLDGTLRAIRILPRATPLEDLRVHLQLDDDNGEAFLKEELRNR